MPAKAPPLHPPAQQRIAELGTTLRARRKALGINLSTVAEAAGMSRITLSRIEKGEASVTLGAWLNVVNALALDLRLEEARPQQAGEDETIELPANISLSDYPELKKLAWQVHGVESLRPAEAFDIYERNWRHVDEQALNLQERELVRKLRLVFAS
jgi:transcriptional regulator with XRE-family HTH domain